MSDKMFCMTCMTWTTKCDQDESGVFHHHGASGCGGRLIYKEQYESLKIHFEERTKLILDIIALAEAFHCCPNCGATDNESKHGCQHCHESFVEEGDAYWFAEWLKKKYVVG
jgi:hypothetical protein